MGNLYSTKVMAVGGRNGRVCSDDGLLDLALSLPPALGGKGQATNPEQLFAAGYAACFENAILRVSRSKGAKIKDDEVEVTAHVGLTPNESDGFSLTVELSITIDGVDQRTADEIVAGAHTICPYSNAVRGNIDVALATTVR